MPPASWLNVIAFRSGSGGLRFKSRAGQIGHSDANKRFATAATFLQQKLLLTAAMTQRWAPQTSSTLQRNTASIMKI